MKALLVRIFLLMLLHSFQVLVAQTKLSPEKVKALGDQACDCTKEISVDAVKDTIIEKINGCIYAHIFEDQITREDGEIKQLVNAALSAKKDTVVGEEKTITIYADEGFNEIQQYMFENCARVKAIIATNNKKNKHSMSSDKNALQHYNEGSDYYANGQYEMAVVSFNKAVKADPKFAFAWDNLGLSYRKMGNYKEAIRCYKKSLEVDPDGQLPLQNMGIAYEYLEDYKNASVSYEAMIKSYPDNPEGYYGAGRVFYFMEDYPKAVDYMFRAYKIYKEAKSPYVNDAGNMLSKFYNELKDKGKLNIFMEAAKKNDIEVN